MSSFPGNRIEGIVERQIREAQERGAFDNLPGAGRPLADLGGPHDENWWLHQYLLREGINGVPFLPPALALRKEAEDLPGTVAGLTSEAQVRAVVGRLNDRILQALKKPVEGPSMTMMALDVDAVVLAWRSARAVPSPVPEPAAGSRSRTWFRRR